MPDIGTMHQLNPEPPHIGTMQQLGSEPLHTGEIITPQAQAEEYAREAQESANNAALSAAAAQSAAETAQQAAESIAPALDEKADAIHTAAGPAPIVSIPDAAAAPVDALTVGVEPVQSGSGDPSPTNVRPISGWTGANVTRTGKNLLDVESFTLVKSSSRTKAIIFSIRPAGTYTFAVNVTANTATKNTQLAIRNMQSSNYIAIKTLTIPAGGTGSFSTSFTANIPFSYIYAFISSSDVETASVTIEDIQLEVGSTATAYEPYQGSTYDITFPSEAGTVYGGTLDVTNGVLTVDRAMIASYAGETLPGEWISDRDVYAAGTTPTTGAQVVYQLATPITYTLTPQEIRTFLGANNIWADTGDVTVGYKADTKLYIDKKFAELQALILEN